MATKRQLESKLRTLIRRLDEAGETVHTDLSRKLPDPRIVQVDVPDLESSYWTEMRGGRMGELRDGPAEDPDIRVTAESDDLIGMIDGNKSLFSSYLAGHIKIQASLSDLLALRKLA